MFRARAARASSKSTRIQKKSTWISRKSVVIAFFSAHDRSTWNPCMTHVESLYDPRGIPVRSTRITNPRGFPRGYPCNYFQLGVYGSIAIRRSNTNNGGVGLYIRNTIKWREIRKSAINHMNETEYIIVELRSLNEDRILVASAYRRPKGRCLADFLEVLSTVSQSYSDVIIMGDLNSDLSATDVSEEGRDLEKLLEKNSYYPVPFGPTHHQARLRTDPVTGQRTLRESHTWIDVICVSLLEQILSHQKSREPFIHGPDYITIDYTFCTAAARDMVTAPRDFRRCDAALHRADVGRALDDAVLASGRDVTPLQWNFYSVTTTASDRHAPMSVRAVRGLSRSWCAGRGANALLRDVPEELLQGLRVEANATINLDRRNASGTGLSDRRLARQRRRRRWWRGGQVEGGCGDGSGSGQTNWCDASRRWSSARRRNGGRSDRCGPPRWWSRRWDAGVAGRGRWAGVGAGRGRGRVTAGRWILDAGRGEPSRVPDDSRLLLLQEHFGSSQSGSVETVDALSNSFPFRELTESIKRRVSTERFTERDLDTCTHVYKIINVKKGSMVRPFTGPHRVIHRDPSRKHFDIDLNGEQVKVSTEHLKSAFTTLNDLPGFENWSPLQPLDDGSNDVELNGENFVVGDGMDLIQLDERSIERVPLGEQGRGRGVPGNPENSALWREEVSQHLSEHISIKDLSVPRDPSSNDNRKVGTPSNHEGSDSRQDSGTHSAPEERENRDRISKPVNNRPNDNSNNLNHDGLPNFIALPPSILDNQRGEVVVDEGRSTINGEPSRVPDDSRLLLLQEHFGSSQSGSVETVDALNRLPGRIELFIEIRQGHFDIDLNGEQVKVSTEHLKSAFTTLNDLPGFENWSPLQPLDDGSNDVELNGENFVVGDGMDLIQLDERSIERVPLGEQGRGRGVPGNPENSALWREEVSQHLSEHISIKDLSVPRDPSSNDNRKVGTPSNHEGSDSRQDSGTHSAPEERENRDRISKPVNNRPNDNSNNLNHDGLPNFIALPPSILDNQRGEVVVDE
ncbi:unnamed protein product, partial [Trichogramma brassicae]